MAVNQLLLVLESTLSYIFLCKRFYTSVVKHVHIYMCIQVGMYALVYNNYYYDTCPYPCCFFLFLCICISVTVQCLYLCLCV